MTRWIACCPPGARSATALLLLLYPLDDSDTISEIRESPLLNDQVILVNEELDIQLGPVEITMPLRTVLSPLPQVIINNPADAFKITGVLLLTVTRPP